jgi:CheY-like chemotaxis protein
VRRTARTAIDWLRAGGAPSVILLDLTMLVMDGHQFLTAKEADPGLARCRRTLPAARGARPRWRRQKAPEPLASSKAALARSRGLQGIMYNFTLRTCTALIFR